MYLPLSCPSQFPLHVRFPGDIIQVFPNLNLPLSALTNPNFIELHKPKDGRMETAKARAASVLPVPSK